jgi:Thioredoxin
MFRISKSLLIGCLLICFTAASCTKHSGEKPALDLYVMSHCPFGIRAEEFILGLINDFNNELTLHVRYIVSKQPDNTFTSLHGQQELDEDLHQIAVQELYGSKFSGYLMCYNSTMNRDKCLSDNGIDKARIDKFVQSGRADKVLDNDYASTEKLGINASPTLYINDHRYEGAIQSEHIIRAVCSGTPSLAYCKTLKPPVDVHITLLTGGWEGIYRPEMIKESLSDFFYRSTIALTEANSKAGRELVQKYNLTDIPVLLFGNNVTMTMNFNTIKARLKDENGDYIDSMNDFGYRHFIDRQEKPGEMVMFVNISDREAVNAGISVLRLLRDYKKSQYTPVINVIGSYKDNESLKAASIVEGRDRFPFNDRISMLTKLYTGNSLQEFNKAYHAKPAAVKAVGEEIAHNNERVSGLGIGQAPLALLMNNTELIDAAVPARSVGIFELSPVIGKQPFPGSKSKGQCAK